MGQAFRIEDLDLACNTMLLDRGFRKGVDALQGSLRSIRLSFCRKLTTGCLTALEGCRNLVRIDLSHLDWLNDSALATLVAVCPQLKEVQLSWCNNVTPDALHYLSKLARLQRLGLGIWR